MTNEDIKLSVVVPVYNSARTLAALTERIHHVLTALAVTWEIVFVDDNSKDASWSILLALREQYPQHVTIIQLMRNFGQHNAIMCGFRHLRGNYVVTIDDDLQNPPEEIPRLLETIESQRADLVYGTIATDKHHSFYRNLASWLLFQMSRLIFDTAVRGSSYRIIRRELVDSVLTYDLNFTFLDGLFAWNSQRITAIPIAHNPRSHGRSGYSFRRLVTLALNMLTNFSLLPLQFVSLMGICLSIVGFLLGGWFLLAHFTGLIAVSGFASLIVAVLVMGGTQLLALGVIGEYLGRIHLNINRKPQFVVRTIQRGAGESAERQSADGPNTHSPEGRRSDGFAGSP